MAAPAAVGPVAAAAAATVAASTASRAAEAATATAAASWTAATPRLWYPPLVTAAVAADHPAVAGFLALPGGDAAGVQAGGDWVKAQLKPLAGWAGVAAAAAAGVLVLAVVLRTGPARVAAGRLRLAFRTTYRWAAPTTASVSSAAVPTPPSDDALNTATRPSAHPAASTAAPASATSA